MDFFGHFVGGLSGTLGPVRRSELKIRTVGARLPTMDYSPLSDAVKHDALPARSRQVV